MSAPSVAPEFPVISKQISVEICGNHTDIIFRDFSDQVFLIITQLQKVGNLVLIKPDEILTEIRATKSYSTKVLLGTDEELLHVIAKNIAQCLPMNKPLLLGIALKDTSRASTKAIEEALLKAEFGAAIGKQPLHLPP